MFPHFTYLQWLFDDFIEVTGTRGTVGKHDADW